MNYPGIENTPLSSSGYIEHDLDGKKIAEIKNGTRRLTIYKGIDAVALTALGVKFFEACIK